MLLVERTVYHLDLKSPICFQRDQDLLTAEAIQTIHMRQGLFHPGGEHSHQDIKALSQNKGD